MWATSSLRDAVQIIREAHTGQAPTLPFDTLPLTAPRRDDTDVLLERIERRAGEAFRDAAEARILSLLAQGPATGESLTTACREAGIMPPGGMDDRAFGPVYRRLAMAGRIHQVGTANRAKGHGSAGARVWGLR